MPALPTPLGNDMGQCFASPKIQQRARDLQEESAIDLSDASTVLWTAIHNWLERTGKNDKSLAKRIVFERVVRRDERAVPAR